jgi:hypothetical protein
MLFGLRGASSSVLFGLSRAAGVRLRGGSLWIPGNRSWPGGQPPRWRLSNDAGNAATELLVIGPPGRRLGALVEGLPHCPDGTWKTTRSANSRTNWAPTCLWHAGVDVLGRCGLQPLAPWGGRGTLGGGCGGSGTQQPRGDILVGMYDGWERRRPHGKVTIRTGFTSTVLVFNTSVLDKQCTGFCPGFSRWQPIFLNCNKSISG